MSYTTAQDVRDFTGISGTSVISDVTISGYIGSAEDTIDTFVGHDFLLHTVNEKYDGGGMRELFLRNYPLVEISGISVNGTSISDYYTDKDIGFIKKKVAFPTGEQNISVDYTYGYSGVPALVKQTATKMASIDVLVAVGNAESKGAESEKFGDYSVKFRGKPYGETISGLESETERNLNELKRLIYRIF